MNNINTIKPRPTFALDSKPMLIWNHIENAVSYKLKMINMTNPNPEQPHLEKEISECEVKIEEGYCKYNYPTDSEPLVQGDTYVLSVETNVCERTLTGQVEVILLEESTQQDVIKFESDLLELNNEQLENDWFRAKESLLVFNEGRSTRPWRLSHILVFLQ